jgi:exopolysaccharide biosynthesis protein
MKTPILLLFVTFCILSSLLHAQLKWTNVDSLYQPLPKSVHLYFTDEKIDTGAFRAFYVIADLKNRKLNFTVDTTLNRRITPTNFYDRGNQPLVVVNCTFFSYETNRSVNVVIKDGKLAAFNQHSIAGRGKDTLKYFHPLRGAIGIDKKRNADVVWLYTDSSNKFPYASQFVIKPVTDSLNFSSVKNFKITDIHQSLNYTSPLKKWKMQTAVGGGPVLLQDGKIFITNEEEMMFTGKAINDKHPRTAMGYTKDGKLVILVVQGRSESGGGATLPQEAEILKDLGCWEALNLDGGGSSCMLVNGKETIKPSDKEGQRAVPAVFIIKRSASYK